MADWQQELLRLVNDARATAGVPPLSVDSRLTEAAQAHSQDQANHRNLSHSGSDGSEVGDRAARAGYDSTFVGENVAHNYPTVQALFSGWMNSSGHRDNILSPNYRHMGLGVAYSESNEPYWTQVFGMSQAGTQQASSHADWQTHGACWRLQQGRSLLSGTREGQGDEELRSQNGRFTFRMQHDGNIVLYKSGQPIWASNTWVQHSSGPYRLVMQDDGNLVAYDRYDKPTWASNTWHAGQGPYRLDIQDDGNCVLYDCHSSPTWSTDTWRHGSS